jgi:hypothetical protein
MERTGVTRRRTRPSQPVAPARDSARQADKALVHQREVSTSQRTRRDQTEVVKTRLPTTTYVQKRGTRKEVRGPHFDGIAIAETFNVAEAAVALGKKELTFRGWIQRELVPAPVLTHGTSRVPLYSKGELEIIARELARHSQDYQYLCEKHTHVAESMHQHMHAFRAHHV